MAPMPNPSTVRYTVTSSSGELRVSVPSRNRPSTMNTIPTTTKPLYFCHRVMSLPEVKAAKLIPTDMVMVRNPETVADAPFTICRYIGTNSPEANKAIPSTNMLASDTETTLLLKK